jgi:hypothetical protein
MRAGVNSRESRRQQGRGHEATGERAGGNKEQEAKRRERTCYLSVMWLSRVKICSRHCVTTVVQGSALPFERDNVIYGRSIQRVSDAWMEAAT